MSRVGNLPVSIPQGVDVKIDDGNIVTVKGPKGTLSKQLSPDIQIKVEGNQVVVSRNSEERQHRAMHGLTRTLINNMVVGVTEGYEKALDIVGVGFKAQKQGKNIILSLGYAHTVEMIEPLGITVDVPSPNKLIVKGIDKQAVGQFAAQIRSKRQPEVYKGKGIRYENEVVKLKEGKAGVKAAK